MTDQKNIFFKALNESEKLSKLTQLSNLDKPLIIIWKKGTTEKHKFFVSDFIRMRSEVMFTKKFPEDLIGEKVLYTFQLSGLSFFGQGEALLRANGQMSIHCNLELYKSERRKNFRLLSFPHHNVFINLKIGKEIIETSNVLNFNGAASQTGIFKNFLDLLDEKKPSFDHTQYLRFRVLDISVTGLAFQFGKIEAELFKTLDSVFHASILEFNGKMLTIPELEILYHQESVASDKKTPVTKAGVSFLNIDTNLDENLSLIINQTLRSIESEFEGFIK